MPVEREILCQSALTVEGWSGPLRIVIDSAGFVEALEADAAAASAPGFIVPGMPNLHSHAFQRQMAGLAEQGSGRTDSFWTWRETMYRLANRVNPEQFQAIAAGLQMEMLEAGYTSCAEFHYLHHQPDGRPYPDLAEMCRRLLAAAEISGMPLTLLPVLYCRAGFGAKDVRDHQRRFFNPPDRYIELIQACREVTDGHPHHRVGMAPHSLRAVPAEALHGIMGDATAGEPIHIHIAEQSAEVEECRSALGAAPVQWLIEHCDIGPNWCLVHATHTDPAERHAAAATGAVAGLCPTTEADLGDGFFETSDWLAAGGHFGIGSDSNLRVSVGEELRLLEFQARLRSLQRIVLADSDRGCGRNLYERAARGGARALSQPVGIIEPGARADFVELDAHHPLLAGRTGDTVLDTWVFAADRDLIRSVWVAGKAQVSAGRHVHREVIEGPFREAMRMLV